MDGDGAARCGAAVGVCSSAGAEIKVGLDVHQGFHVGVVQNGHGHPGPPRRFAPGEFVPWVRGLLKAGHSVHVVHEACGLGFALCRELEAAGARCTVVAPQALDERRTGIKNDPRDARALCLRLGRWLDGNRHALAVIRVPSEEEERARAEHRQRQQLVRHRNRLQAQGRALVVNAGLCAPPPHWWRERAWRGLSKVLPGWVCGQLAVLRPLLAPLDEQIAALGRRIESAAPAQIPHGLGRLTTVMLTREVCDWHRFHNRRQVSSYTGLCPGEHSSGGKRIQGSVTKHGNPRLRAALVELAWRLVRFQPQYPPVAKRLLILGKGARATGAARKKAIVAVARQLAVDLWRLHTGRCTATQLGLRCASSGEPEAGSAGAPTAPAEEVSDSGGTLPPPAQPPSPSTTSNP